MKNLLIILFILIFFGCSSDKEPPVIYITSPGDNATFSGADTVILDAVAVDNKSLNSYSITIMHTDTFVLIDPFNVLHDPFLFESTGVLSGKTEFINSKFTISDSPAAGLYRLLITVSDVEGNASLKSTFFRIRNLNDSVSPAIPLISVDTTKKNPTLINLSFSDDLQLAVAHYFIINRTVNDTVINRSFIISDTVATLQDTFSIPDGSYKIKVRARDRVNNEVEKEQNFLLQ